MKIQIIRKFDITGRFIDRTGRAHPDGGDIIHCEPGSFHCHMYGFCNIVKNLRSRAGRIGFQLTNTDNFELIVHYA